MQDWSPYPTTADHPPIGLRDRGLWVVLAATLALQLMALGHTEGYQLADSVEYMDRADMLVRGEEFDPRTPRPFTLSALLVPLFWAAHELQLDTYAVPVAATRGLQMLVGLLTVFVAARIGSRIGGRAVGLSSGLLLGACLPFTRYTITGLADAEAMLLVALAVDSLLGPRTPKRGLLTGLYLGGAIAFTYKSIPVAGAILLGVFLRERLRHGPWLRAVLAMLLLCLAVTALIDTRIYGDFGSSIGGYFLVNTAAVVGRLLHFAGFVGAATWIGNTFLLDEGRSEVHASETAIYQVDPNDYYWTNAGAELYPWPLLLLVLLGSAASLRRFRFPETLIAFVVVVDVFVLSQKGHKSFRLMMPILPLIAILGGLGVRALRGGATASLGRRAAVWAYLVVGLVTVPGRIAEQRLARHGGYWDAMEIINAETRRQRARAAEAGREPPSARVASAFHWAVTLRQTRGVELVRLPLDPLEFGVDSAELRQKTLTTLASLDWFVGHMQVFAGHPALVESLNENFEVHAILYDGRTYDALMPIFVLRRRSEAEAGRRFYRVRDLDEEGLAAFRRGVQHPSGLRFRHRAPDGTPQEVELVGWDVETALGAGETAIGEVAWVTYHWLARTRCATDFVVRDRLTDHDGRATLAGLDGHAPAYGAHPMSEWTPGDVLSESYVRVLPRGAMEYGGAHRRGELVPTMVWVALEGAPAAEGGAPRMRPLDPRDGRALDPPRPRQGDAHDYRWAGDGFFWDAGGRIAVGGFWLPIPPDLRVPDDGRPLVR